MARKRLIETIDAETAKVMTDMSKLQDRYDKLADKLKDLQCNFYAKFSKKYPEWNGERFRKWAETISMVGMDEHIDRCTRRGKACDMARGYY